MKETSPPRGMFKGLNFMTPNVRAYYKLRESYAELSTGRGMQNQPIFGVTVRPDDGRSKLFQSESAALDYIEELSERCPHGMFFSGAGACPKCGGGS